MEDMDIEQVVEIPDTPDRLAAVRHIRSGERVGKESSCSSYASLFRNPDFKNEEPLSPVKVRSMLGNENGHHKKPNFHPPKGIRSANGTQCRSNSIYLSPLQNVYASSNTDSDSKLKTETEHLTGTQHLDRGKCLSSKFPSKSSAFRHDHGVLDLTGHSGDTKITEQGYTNLSAEEIGKEKLATDGSSLHHHHNSLNTRKGKGELNMNTCNSDSLSMARGKGIDLSCDSQNKTEKLGPGSLHCVTSPKVIGRKRLVRNGCISPYNIAAQMADQNTNSSRDVEHNHSGSMVSNGQPCFVDTGDSVLQRYNRDTNKGKGVTIPHWPSKENGAGIIRMSSSNPVIKNVEATETADSNRDAVGCLEGSDGWRSTHNYLKDIDNSGNPPGCHFRRNEGLGGYNNSNYKNILEKRANRSGKDKAECDSPDPLPTTSGIVSAVDQITGSRPVSYNLKRPKKHVLTMKNHGQCSRLASNDSEIVFLGSTGESLNSRSSRMQGHRHLSVSNPVVEIDKSSPEIINTRPQSSGCATNEDSDARAIQVEADEILARELQEQLYQEVPVFSTEVDEHIARSLQQEEGALRASSSGDHHMFHPRGSLRTQSYRQPQQTRSRNPSVRRGTHGRALTSTRIARLRNHSVGQSPALSSRGTLQFPMGMDMDTRMDILEALEALGDFSDMGMANRRLQVQRDFNENDYEMLLALDDNSHSVGASSNQINNLPESTVRTDTLEEACAICLESPTMGDVIRHLPCLHKFHKDCIDPWLSRKTSCPVCKSSIT